MELVERIEQELEKQEEQRYGDKCVYRQHDILRQHDAHYNNKLHDIQHEIGEPVAEEPVKREAVAVDLCHQPACLPVGKEPERKVGYRIEYRLFEVVCNIGSDGSAHRAGKQVHPERNYAHAHNEQHNIQHIPCGGAGVAQNVVIQKLIAYIRRYDTQRGDHRKRERDHEDRPAIAEEKLCKPFEQLGFIHTVRADLKLVIRVSAPALRADVLFVILVGIIGFFEPAVLFDILRGTAKNACFMLTGGGKIEQQRGFAVYHGDNAPRGYELFGCRFLQCGNRICDKAGNRKVFHPAPCAVGIARTGGKAYKPFGDRDGFGEQHHKAIAAAAVDTQIAAQSKQRPGGRKALGGKIFGHRTRYPVGINSFHAVIFPITTDISGLIIHPPAKKCKPFPRKLHNSIRKCLYFRA